MNYCLQLKKKEKYWCELYFLFNAKCGWTNLKIMEQIIYFTRKCITDWHLPFLVFKVLIEGLYGTALKYDGQQFAKTGSANPARPQERGCKDLLARIMRYTFLLVRHNLWSNLPLEIKMHVPVLLALLFQWLEV